MTKSGDLHGLILWDIDHTLIETRGVGAELYRAAFEEVTGVEMKHGADVTGATEPEIFAETLRLNGLTSRDGAQDRYAAALGRQYDRHREELTKRGRVLPGVGAALAALHAMPGLVQSVLTGNLARFAQVKLDSFGLSRYLDLEIAAYGGDADDRPGLVAVSQASAARKYGTEFGRANTVIIGDSESDINTGRRGGARVIGVASGRAGADALRQAGADSVLESLSDTIGLLSIIAVQLQRDGHLPH